MQGPSLLHNLMAFANDEGLPAALELAERWYATLEDLAASASPLEREHAAALLKPLHTWIVRARRKRAA